jgi:3-dehydroquinate synthase
MKNKTTLAVQSFARTYHIHIAPTLLEETGVLLGQSFELSAGKKMVVLYDSNCNEYLDTIKESLKEMDVEVISYSLPAGEGTKSFSTIYPVYSWLIENAVDRNTPVLALGGGVTGDAAGFVASTYLRGVPFVQIPTTLLAMVDSSIGGKVGINHELGKNLIGSFYPPHLVLIDIETLRTLPEREFCCGLAECVKHALLSGDSLFSWMEEHAALILDRDENTLLELLKRNIEIKKSIVEKDEKESGVRAYLNLGHTFGHALEKEYGYSSKLLHGEAVSLGLIAASKLSADKNTLTKDHLSRLENLLTTLKLPVRTEITSQETLIQNMLRDKKMKNNLLHFVLLNGFGGPYVSSDITTDEIRTAWSYLTS